MSQSNKTSKSKTASKYNFTQMSSLNEIKQIMLDEGFRSITYMDPEGKLTIGYGFNLSDNTNRKVLKKCLGNKYDFDKLKNKQQKISKKDAEMLLREIVTDRIKKLQKEIGNWNKLNIETKNILINMAYQLGIPRFKGFVKMLKALKKEDYENVVKEMRDSRWYRQTGNRARRLIERMKKANNVK